MHMHISLHVKCSPEKTCITRLKTSDDSLPVKCMKLWLMFELFTPSRMFVLGFFSPLFLATSFVGLGHLTNEWSAPAALYLFWYFHIILSGSLVWIALKMFSSSKKHLDSFMYGPNMTLAF